MAYQNCVYSFFKIMVGHFTTKLEVLSAFVKKFKTRLPKIVVLEYEGGGGLSWKMEIEENENGPCYFTKGWSDFVKDVKLNIGDSIVFRLINNKTFEIMMYDATCCEKFVDGPAIARRITVEEHSDVNAARKYHKNVIMEDGIWEDETARCSSPSYHLIRILKKYEKHFFRLGLTKRKGTVIKDHEGRVWPIKLALSRWGSHRQHLQNFLRVNDVTSGDTVNFQFVGGEGNAVDVRIMKKGPGAAEI